MLDGRWRANVERGLEPVGKGLQRAGINADVLTVIGLGFAVGTAFLIASGHLVLAVFGVIATGVLPPVVLKARMISENKRNLSASCAASCANQMFLKAVCRRTARKPPGPSSGKRIGSSMRR